MIGIDVHERPVKADGPFIQGDERADRKRVHVRHGDGDRFAATLVKRAAASAQKTLEIIAARYARFHLKSRRMPILSHFDESDKEIGDTVAQLLDIGVLIG